jgi:4'-phosphopantetheinyl transferase
VRLWARKEALLKATGEGIGAGLAVPVLPARRVERQGRTWTITDIEAPRGYAAAVAHADDGPVTVHGPGPTA